MTPAQPPSKDSPAGQLRTALGAEHGATVAERLNAIELLRHRLAEEEDQIAFSLRLSGSTWQQIADAFGVSRQAAHERFSGSAELLDRLATAAGRTMPA